MAIIQTLGLHWSEEHVQWGYPGQAGKLLGATSKTRNAIQVDFRNQRGIYALYADFELVYVGQAGRGKKRLYDRLFSHCYDHLSERWNRFSWFGTQWVKADYTLSADTKLVKSDPTEVLNTLEAVAIAVAEPRLNLQRGRWPNAVQYYQYQPSDESEDEEVE